MTAWNPQANDIFLNALEIAAPHDRRTFIERECGDVADLRTQVESLIAASEKAGSFLECPPSEVAAVICQSITEQPGNLIAGRYKLLEPIGEGGMGTVWVAEQTEPVRRKVALKVIKAGMDSKSVVARFEAERQALAVMDHPNIAKVLDGGLTETGRPYFVMEYFKGVPITEFCNATRLSIPERLKLFVQVCAAVQHAHQKGIIHRDLKPSNILVALYNDVPVPKVIDFGLAKAMHQTLTEQPFLTARETVLGTPMYMSPEQAQLNNLDVDTRSDIYSLGVLLYELLTGTPPLEEQRFEKAAWDEVKRIIREEEPHRPSLRLSSAQSLPSLAAGRQTEPAQLMKLVRGEMDWIVMKALEKDRSRRYETASSFAADVQRYLNDEPVQAGPPSTIYRLRKFVHRHKAVVLAASLVLIVLLGGIIGTSWGLVRAHSAGLAEAKRAEGEKLAKQAAQKAETNERKQRQIAEAKAEEAKKNFLKAREAVKAIMSVLPSYHDSFVLVSYRGSEDVDFVQGIFGKTWTPLPQDKQKDLLEKALQYYEGFLEQDGLDPDLRLEVATAYLYRAAITEQRNPQNANENDQAEAAYRHALTILTRLAAEPPRNADARRLFARGCERLAYLLKKSPRSAEAEKLYAQAIDLQSSLVKDFPDVATYHMDRAATQFSWGTFLRRSQRLQEAETAYRQAQRDFEEYLALSTDGTTKRSYVGYVCRSLGSLLVEMNQPTKGEDAYRQALTYLARPAAKDATSPPRDDDLAHTHVRLGQLFEQTGRPKEAEQEYRTALVDYEKLVKSNSSSMYTEKHAAILAILAMIIRDQPNGLTEARELVQRAIGLLEPEVTKDPKDTRARSLLYSHYELQCDLAIAAKDHATVARVVKLSIDAAVQGRSAAQRYKAACRLAKCVPLARSDSELTDSRREELIKQYSSDAMILLREAIAMGFVDFEHMKQDKDLDSLRSGEDYQKMVKELDTRSRP